jgi:hypothetical protein
MVIIPPIFFDEKNLYGDLMLLIILYHLMLLMDRLDYLLVMGLIVLITQDFMYNPSFFISMLCLTLKIILIINYIFFIYMFPIQL